MTTYRKSTHDLRTEMELDMFASLCALVYQIDQGFNPDGETVDAARRAINGWDDYWNDRPTVVDAVSPEVNLANVRALRNRLNRYPPKVEPLIASVTRITQRHWDEPSA